MQTLLLALSLLASDPVAGDSVAIAQLARNITAGETSSFDRGRTIYSWIAHNVTYDADALFGRSSTHGNTAEETYRIRKAVCEGFANLFVRMATEVGLEAEKVIGYAKGIDYATGRRSRNPNHAWVALRTERGWILADPTWGSGQAVGDRFQPEFTWWYYDVRPEALILSHHPRQSQWQLVAQPMSRREFDGLAMIPRMLLEIGISPQQLRTEAARRGHSGFPVIAREPGLRISEAPLSGRLQTGTVYTWAIHLPGAEAVVAVDRNGWHSLSPAPEGGYKGSISVSGPGTVMVVARLRGDDQFRTLMAYEVR